MSRDWKISRRHALKGLGVALGLPLFDQMAWAEEPWRHPFADPDVAGGGTDGGKAPIRMGFMFVPSGVHMPDWRMKGDAKELPYILEPLGELIRDVTVIDGLHHDKARANGDGAGDHARETGTFLTGAQCKKTAGKDIRCGVSVDQVAARRIGYETALPSIELGIDRSATAGNCDSGYSCAYSSNISWRTPTTPCGKETDPREAFKRLFIDTNQAAGNQRKASEISLRKSVLDLVQEDAKGLAETLGPGDKRKLDEFLDSTRELEKRIEHAVERGGREEDEDLADIEEQAPEGKPKDYAEHVRLMFDVLALAWQTDSTRIASFMFANGGSNRTYKSLGVTGGHHSLSHHGGDPAKHEAIRTINRHHVELFAYFLAKLKGMEEAGGTVLDNSMIVYGGAISDGDRHNHDDLPVLLAGSGGGTIRTGRLLQARGNFCDLFIAMLHRAGVRVQSFGDGDKPLPGL